MKFQKTRVLGLQIADFFEYIFFLYCTRCYVSLHVIGLKNKKHSFLVLWLKKSCKVSVVQSLRFVQLFGTSWTIALQASLSFTVSWSLLKLMFTESVMPSKYLILCRPFSSCLQSFPASGSFLVSWLFALGDQSIGASASFLPMNNQGWFPLGLTDLICLLFKGLSRIFSNTTVQKHQFFSAQLSL